jgi:UDP-N-acetylmuramoyl-L-alanyl-D-glutamate--2,6-diaminopimelate ligase
MEKILNIIKRFIPLKVFRSIQPIYHFLLNWMAAVIYKNPSDELVVIGVTGTTGKTTSVCLVAETLKANGFKVGFTSTAIFNDGKKEWLNDKKMTMLGRFFTQKILREMVNNGCQYAIVETTSEGIRQYRHRFINYDVLVFTGIYPEHIESHGSFENYKKAKGELFKHLKKCKKKFSNDRNEVVQSATGLKKIDLNRIRKTVVVNGDDKYVDYFLEFWSEQKIVFGKKLNDIVESDGLKIVKATKTSSSKNGISFIALDTLFDLQLLGSFNVMNAMAAIGVCKALDIEVLKIKKGLETISGVAGRLEKIDKGQDFTVIVDYAFEPNAVEKLYETVGMLPHNNIIHVLGSTGGGRDIARRPILGELAGTNANFVIVTNEDPYDDDPKTIIDQVALGAERAGKKIDKDLFKIGDRRKAIEKAIDLAGTGDIVLITGKGSEQAICVADGEKIKWDDREEAAMAICRK